MTLFAFLCGWFFSSCRPPPSSYEGYGYLIIAPEASIPAVVDLAAYKAFHTNVLGTLPQVHSLTTYVVMDSPKDERG